MADSKITALTAISTVDPTADPLVIVDVSDTSMAASGTTKKSTINQLLGAGGTATLASATITGDLTVRTTGLTVNSSGVGVGTSSQSSFLGNSPKKLVIGDGTQTPALTLYGGTANVSGIYYAKGTVGNEAYRGFIEYNHAVDALTVGISGSTAMTLNANGLGLGVTPSAWGGSYKALQLLSVARSIAATGAGVGDLTVAFNAIYDSTDSRWEYAGTGDKAGRYSQTGSGNHRWFVSNTAGTAGNEITDFASAAMTLDASGNLGLGVTPAAAVVNNRKLEIAGDINSAVVLGTNSSNASARNWATVSNWNTYGDLAFLQSNALGGDPLASGAGTTRMTLDASGNLILLSSNTPATLTTNGQLTVNATSNTNLRFSYRGSDGTTRVANITLA